jgi:D-alanine-D-alanine ligase
MDNTILLFGGSSEERLVSVASAQNVSRQVTFDKIFFLHKDGAVFRVSQEELQNHQNPFVKPFEPNTRALANSLEAALEEFRGGVVFLALHGTQGEDGSLQSWFEKNKISFTGSGSVASRNAFEKAQAKAIVTKAHVPVAEELILTKGMPEAKEQLKEFFLRHKKIVLKPLANGSSVGLHIVSDEATLENAAADILTGKFGDYMAEAFLQGRELTVGVIEDENGTTALPPSEVVMESGRAFDYEGKYLGHGTTEITPAVLAPEDRSQAQALALAAHKLLRCYGYSRTDMMLTPRGPVFLETNTLPGLSKASFLPQQLAAKGISMETFVENQLVLAKCRI